MKALLVVLLILLSIVHAHRWYNWQFDITCDCHALIVPRTEAELASFVSSHYQKQSHFKVAGNGHAFGNMSTCIDKKNTTRETYIISLTNFVHIEVSGTVVTFGAGWDLVDLVPKLREFNLSVQNLGTERVQNYIGAFTTGTHGTGKVLGNLATQVIGFKVMDAKGAVHVVNSTYNADWLPSLRISLGALGIITEVTIQAEPLNFLKRTTVVYDAKPTLREMYQDVYNYNLLYDRVMVWGPHMTWDTTTKNWTITPKMSVTYWEPTNYTQFNNCSKNFCANGCGDCLRDYVCYDEASDAVATPPAGVCNRFFYAEIEHFIPVENFVDAAVEYTEFQLKEASQIRDYNNMAMIYELRFVKGDKNYMSPVNTYNNSLSGVFGVIEIDWYMTYNNFRSLWEYQSLAAGFEAKLGLKYNARPHWGKMSWFDGDYARAIYPMLPEFLSLQRKLDPQCQFINQFLKDHLGMSDCDISHKMTPRKVDKKEKKVKDEL